MYVQHTFVEHQNLPSGSLKLVHELNVSDFKVLFPLVYSSLNGNTQCSSTLVFAFFTTQSLITLLIRSKIRLMNTAIRVTCGEYEAILY